MNDDGSLDNGNTDPDLGPVDGTPGDRFGTGTDARVLLTFPNTFTTGSNALSIMEAEYDISDTDPNPLLIGGYRTYNFTGPCQAQCTGCDFTVVALRTSDGALDPNFGESGAGYTFTNFCIAFYAPVNGCTGTSYPSHDSAYDLLCWEELTHVWHIIAVGSTDYTNRSNNQFAAVRYDNTGHRETTWGPNNNGLIAVASGAAGPTSLAAAYDGDIIERASEGGDGDFYAAGVGTPGNTGTDFVAVRWNEDGTLDSSFGSAGQVKLDLGTATAAYSDTARGIKIMPSGAGADYAGTITIGGYTGPTTAAGRIGVAQFLPSNRVTVNAPQGGAPALAPGAPSPDALSLLTLQSDGFGTSLLTGEKRDDDLIASA